MPGSVPTTKGWRPSLPDPSRDWELRQPAPSPSVAASVVRQALPAVVLAAEVSLSAAPLVIPLAAPAVAARVALASRWLTVALVLGQVVKEQKEGR